MCKFKQDKEIVLSGGRVNETFLLESNGLRTVRQMSKPIGVNAEEILREISFGDKVGVDTIQINPEKYVNARVLTEFLTANKVPVVWISNARNFGDRGLVEMDCVKGIAGEKVDDEIAVYQVMSQVIAGMHNLELTGLRAKFPGVTDIDEWLVNRIDYLTGRLKRWGVPGIDWFEDFDIKNAIKFVLNKLDNSEQIPFVIVHDDMAPRSLIFEDGELDKPVVIDVESLRIGHPFIDGLCRSMYWGPVGERLVLGEDPNYDLIKFVMDGYNTKSTKIKMKEEDRDLWIVLTEIFWLMDIMAIDWMIKENRTKTVEGISRRMANLKKIIEYISCKDTDAAIKIALS